MRDFIISRLCGGSMNASVKSLAVLIGVRLNFY